MYKKSERQIKHIDFYCWDLIVIELSMLFACFIRNGIHSTFTNEVYRVFFIVLIFVDLFVMIFLDTMKDVLKRGFYRELVATIWQSLVLLLCITTFFFLTKTSEIVSRFVILLGIFIYTCVTYLFRLFWKEIIKKTLRNNFNTLLIVASKINVKGIIEEVNNDDYGQHKIVGLIVNDESMIGNDIADVHVVGTYDDVVKYVLKHWVDEVLICVDLSEKFPSEIIEELTSMGVTVHVTLENTTGHIAVKQTTGNIGDLLVLTSAMKYVSPRQQLIKRTIDILGGLIGTIITGILYLILAPMIKRESPGPAFFVQERVGRNGKRFKMYKFRSMYMDAEERKTELMEQNKIKDGLMFKMDFDPRIIGNKIDENGNQKTGIGQKIRDWSLDEFPQFINVLKGDMSLVGTRPPLVTEVEHYDAHHKARLGTKPGITGLWQVSGRSNILDFENVVKLDTQYINNWSLGLDIKILCKTVMVVLKRDGSM